MKTHSLLLILAAALTGCLSTGRAETLGWWRLADPQSPQTATEGGPDLKWWSADKHPIVLSEGAAPAALYRMGQTPPDRVFAVSASCQNAPGGLLGMAPADYTAAGKGLTIEGFFQTTQIKDKLEVQAIVTAGDGWLDASWAIRLVDGRPNFAVFQGDASQPAATVEIPEDLRDGGWHFFVARLHPSAVGHPARISLAVTSEGRPTAREESPLPEGFVLRRAVKPLLVGRSSLYIDAKEEYRGTWDTFQGALSDLRISEGVLSDSELLGVLRN